MKRMIIGCALLAGSVAYAALPHSIPRAYQVNDEHNGQAATNEEASREQDAADAFDAFMESNEDVPSDMIVAPKPVSPCEAYFKEIGVQILMKYITLKIWLEHQWQSWNCKA